jgi:hypothetical protein
MISAFKFHLVWHASLKAFTYFVQTTALCVCLLFHVEITSLTKENHMIEDPRKFEVENK